MVVLHVTVQVKPSMSRSSGGHRYDAEHSEKDEPGCLRFRRSRIRTIRIVSYFYESTGQRRWRRTGKPRILSTTSRRAGPCWPARPSAASVKTWYPPTPPGVDFS
jgi:hypothetical protein